MFGEGGVSQYTKCRSSRSRRSMFLREGSADRIKLRSSRVQKPATDFLIRHPFSVDINFTSSRPDPLAWEDDRIECYFSSRPSPAFYRQMIGTVFKSSIFPCFSGRSYRIEESGNSKTAEWIWTISFIYAHLLEIGTTICWVPDRITGMFEQAISA